jgi:hypothetical protein
MFVCPFFICWGGGRGNDGGLVWGVHVCELRKWKISGGNAWGLRCTFWDMEACACVSHCILCVGVFCFGRAYSCLDLDVF